MQSHTLTRTQSLRSNPMTTHPIDPAQTIKKLKENVDDLKQIIKLIDQTLKPLTVQQQKLKQLLMQVNYSLKFTEEDELAQITRIELTRNDSIQLDQLIKQERDKKMKCSMEINVNLLKQLNLKSDDPLNELFIWILNTVYGVQEHGYSWPGFKQNILTNQHFKQFMGLFSLSSDNNYKVTQEQLNKKNIYLQRYFNHTYGKQIQALLSIAEIAVKEYEYEIEKKKRQEKFLERKKNHRMQYERLLYKKKQKQQTKKELVRYIKEIQPIRLEIIRNKKEVQLKRNNFLLMIKNLEQVQRVLQTEEQQNSRRAESHRMKKTQSLIYNPQKNINQNGYQSLTELKRKEKSLNSLDKVHTNLRSSQQLAPSQNPTLSRNASINKTKQMQREMQREIQRQIQREKQIQMERRYLSTGRTEGTWVKPSTAKYSGSTNKHTANYQQFLHQTQQNINPKQKIIESCLNQIQKMANSKYKKSVQLSKIGKRTQQITSPGTGRRYSLGGSPSTQRGNFKTDFNPHEQGCQRCLLF